MSIRCSLVGLLLLLVPVAGGAQAPAFELAWGSHGRTDGEFESITGVHVTTDGIVWVADIRALQRFEGDGTFLTRWNNATTYGLSGPSDVTVLDDGGVIVLGRDSDFVLRLSPQGTYIESRYLCPDTHACPLGLWAITRTSGNHVFVNLYRWGQVLRLNGNFETVATWNGFFRPTGIAINARDEVFVSDSQRHQVQRFDSTGAILATWGSLGKEPGQFDEPCGVAVDSVGLVYVVDRNNHRIQAFDFAGEFRFAWGTEGSGPGQFGQFLLPCGIDVGPDGSIYVGDTGNHRVQKFSRPVGVSERSWDRVKTLFR